MLKHIYVKNFILFEEQELELNESFSVFCGETGAGKSLLIDAISILMGGRANQSFVKVGKDKAVIEGLFECSNQQVRQILINAGIDIEDELVITREITKEGKSTARINHHLVTISLLKDLSIHLVDIHSQHDNQYLLNSRYHLHLLDQYASVNQSVKKVEEAYHLWKNEQKKLEDALCSTYNEDDLDFLTFQVNEIEKVDIDEETYEELLKEEKYWASFEKSSTVLKNSLAYFEDHIMQDIYEGCRTLDAVNDDEIKQVQSNLYDGYYALEEGISRLNRFYESMEFDENRFNEVQQQLFELNNVIRKSGGSLLAMKRKKNEMLERIEQISHRQEFIDQQQIKVNQSEQVYLKLAKDLSKKRKAKAKDLVKEILAQLHDLYLEYARFEILFEEDRNAHGIDRVTFLISMNPGSKLEPLAKVASGGELSRFMLGMKVIFTQLANVDTVIFDEIDTGVSGRVALAIGQKMATVGKQAQVFAVSHLAQVAACANEQYLVEKQTNSENTTTSILLLDYEKRLEILGYMATGNVSESSIKAAAELYHSFHDKRL